ncbi:hypothetical protein D3C76_1514960 [compost metagenome]
MISGARIGISFGESSKRINRSRASSNSGSVRSTYSPRPDGKAGTPRGPASANRLLICAGSMFRRTPRLGFSGLASSSTPLIGNATDTTM